MALRRDFCCGNLRIKCLIIGYMNLIAAIVDIVLHFFIVAVVSRGFECDVDIKSLEYVNFPWLVPVLFIINLGTHGFYPFPYMMRTFSNVELEYMSLRTTPRCYPGMFHIYQIDVLNFMINAIWLKFVITYVRAVHRKDPEPMRMFLGLSVVKLVLQVLYFAYQPDLQADMGLGAQWIKLVDIGIASIFLLLINTYTKQLRIEKAQQQVVDQPPSYIECLINAVQKEKEDKIVVTTVQPTEQKIDLQTDVATKAQV